MNCDYCGSDLAGEVPEVDAAGRQTQACCRPCKLAQIATAAARLGAQRSDLMDELIAVLEREIH